MGIDTQWANVSLLLPLNNNLLDARGHVMTASNGAALSSAVGNPFGAGNALYCDGVNDALTATSSDFTLGTTDCSVQFWFYPVAAGMGLQWGRLLALGPDAVNGSLYIIHNSTTNPLQLRFDIYNGGAYSRLMPDSAITITSGAWHFLQLDRVSGVWSAYIDNSLYATQSTSINLTQTLLSIGSGTTPGFSMFQGYFSDVRITKGAYRSSHAVPGTYFPRPTISGVTYNAAAAPVSKVVTAFKRSTLALVGAAVSEGGTGAYKIYPNDYSEHVVVEFDTTTYPLVDGGSGENANIYDRVIPGSP